MHGNPMLYIVNKLNLSHVMITSGLLSILVCASMLQKANKQLKVNRDQLFIYCYKK